MHNGSCGKGMLRLAPTAHIQSLGGLPIFFASAFGANKPFRLFAFEKVIHTCVFITKPLIKFSLVFRKIFYDRKFAHRWPPFVLDVTGHVRAEIAIINIEQKPLMF
jgi:hypothetical protein